MKRRTLLKYASALTLAPGSALVLPACGGDGGNDNAVVSTLPIPQALRADAGEPVTLQLQKGRYAFLDGKPTDTFGINGALLGPALFVRSGSQFRARVDNALGEASVLHWHGLLVDGDADGGPQSAISHGQSYAVSAPVDQPAATLWYHAHPHGRTGYQTAMGIGGMLIVEDAASQGLGLPLSWGEDDIPLVLQDKYLNDAGQIVYKLNHNTTGIGWFGQHMFVNGVRQPAHPVPRGWVRLRLLNACNARMLLLKLGSGQPFHVIASDGGLLPQPVSLTELEIVPGERFEIMVDASGGQPIDLVMARYDAQYGANTAPFDQDYRLLTLHPVLPSRGTTLPSTLARLPEADAPDGIRQRRIDFTLMGHFPVDPDPAGPLPEEWPFDFALNDEDAIFDDHTLMHINQITVDDQPMASFDMTQASFTVPRHATERWTLSLRQGDVYPHPFHVHGTQFRVLSIDGNPPPAHLRGWKDTVRIAGADTVRSAPGTVEILVHFARTAILPHPYMVHCHTLEHEDGGMMLGFAVV